MKRILILACLLIQAFCLGAQNYDFKPRETWPYLLEEFTSGAVHTSGGVNLNEGWYNVSVVDGKLHYIKDGRIMEADMRQIQYVRIGEAMYVNRQGALEQVVSEEGNCALLRSALVNMDRLAKSDIGYGVSSAVASTQNLNNLGLAEATVSMELEAAIAGAKVGSVLPLRVCYSFLLGAKQVEATKAAVLALPDIDKEAAKAFFKQEKINWNKPESLAKVLKYLADTYKVQQ
ncbi:MAG: hypothetical protein IK031_04185 [Bacteroidales bacterium]|nr:hypothetical protein [Bacteroidales bacterium]